MTDAKAIAAIEKFDKRNSWIGRVGLALICAGFPAYAAGIWTSDGRWGKTGLLIQVVGVLLFVTCMLGLYAASEQRKKLTKVSPALEVVLTDPSPEIIFELVTKAQRLSNRRGAL